MNIDRCNKCALENYRLSTLQRNFTKIIFVNMFEHNEIPEEF